MSEETTPVQEVPSQLRKERMQLILEGQVNAEFEASAAFKGLQPGIGGQPVGVGSGWVRGLVLSAFLSILLVCIHSRLPSSWLVGGAALAACAFLQAVFECLKSGKEAAAWTAKLSAPLEEVVETKNALEKYLVELDKRTSKYFHCVTNTKVSTYCVLRQILAALEERITEVNSFLDLSTGAGMLSAQDALCKQLSFRDGFLQNTGKLYALPLARIKPAIVRLIADLDESLIALEAEIRR
jgi:hypothetical protein